MAFDGHQSTFANSLFQSYPRQTGVDMGGINSGSGPASFVSIPGALHQEQNNASYVPWSHNTQDEPYEPVGCTQPSSKSRRPTDNTDCDGEADLQGLVSNILDEAESWDGYYGESLPTGNPIWSPKILREELLQYFNSEAKTLHNTSFSANNLFHEIISKAQDQSVEKEAEELSQQSSDLATKQWLFSLPNGDSNSFRPHKLPPGLPMPNAVKPNASQTQQIRNVSQGPYSDRGTDQPVNNFLGLSDIFRSQNEMNGSHFDGFCEDRFIQSGAHPISNEQYAQDDINQLVNSFQSFMTSEHDNACYGDFSNINKHSVGMPKEDGMADQWQTTSPAMSTQSTPTMHVPKQLLGDMGTVQRGKIGGVRKQTFKHDALQDLPDFSPRHTQYFQQAKAFPAPLNLLNQHQNKMTLSRENLSMNQFSKQRMQPEQFQRRIKPQFQGEKKGMHMSGALGERFPRIQRSNTCMAETDRQPFSQNPYISFQGRMQSRRFDGENNMVTVGNGQHLTSFMYPVNDLQRHSNISINSNFSPRFSLTHGNGVAGTDMRGVVSPNEAAGLNSYIGDMWTQRRESTFPGMVSTVPPSLLMSQGGPVIQLSLYLDECYEQWKCLEKERKRIEIILRKAFPGKRTSSVANTNLPKTPPNTTRVDHLIVNHMREQAKVASLLDRMKSLCGIPLHINIQTALKSHHMAVCVMEARCKESMNTTKLQQQGFHFTESRDTLLMVMALKELAATTRRLCSALWCALQMTLPKPAKTQSYHVYEEVTCTERCCSPFQGYSFQL